MSLFLGLWFVLASAISSGEQQVAAADTNLNLNIPNPFTSQHNGFYLLEGRQLTQSTHKPDETFHVRNYFSLRLGLSYTIYTEPESGESYAIIGDSSFQAGKTYILRNVDETNPSKIDCELDHIHNHKHVFPFQYDFDLEQVANATERRQSQRLSEKKGKRKTDGKVRASIYGPGAIWLNLIGRNVRSSEVQSESPFTDANVWEVHENDLSIELAFAKPNDEDLYHKADFGTDLQQLIDRTQPKWFKVSRSNALDSAGKGKGATIDGTFSAMEQNDYFTIDTFQSDLTTNGPEDSKHAKALQRLIPQLLACRVSNAKHHVFPSALKYLTLSPQRLVQFSYIKHTFPLFDSQLKLDGSYDEKHHRYINEIEFVTELLSLTKEAQLCQYEKLPVESGTGSGLRADVFLKFFTGEYAGGDWQSPSATSATATSRSRSTRHSTSFYHLVEVDSKVDSCSKGEREPSPKGKILSRAIHFNRYANDGNIKLSGHLTGLTALLLNAADIHYKEFNLFKKRIEVSMNVYDLASRTSVETDEWIVHDRKSSWDIHFYFKQLGSDDDQSVGGGGSSISSPGATLAQTSIEQLVRVDIRDSHKSSDNVAKVSEENLDDDFNLLMRFDIVSVERRLPEDAVDFYFTPPDLCFANDDSSPDLHDDDDKDEDEDFSIDTEDEEEFYDKYDNIDDDGSPQDSDDEDETNRKHAQEQGEDFEYSFGKMVEHTNEFPNFFEFLKEDPVYEIVSKITLKRSDGVEDSIEKSIYMSERVDVRRETSSISIYLSEAELHQRQAYLTYWFNYESEMLFVVRSSINQKSSKTCKLIDDIDEPWLRLLSKEIEYFTEPDEIGLDSRAEARNSIIESNRLRLYGVGALWRYASESADVELLGRSRAKINKDGHEYFPVVYSLDESDMSVHFVFMWNETQAQEDRALAQGKKSDWHRQANELLHLSSVYFSGNYLDTYTTDFRPVELNIMSFNTSPLSKLIALPSTCLQALSKANEFHRKLYEDLMLMPKFEDLFNESDTYYARYSIVQSVKFAPTDDPTYNHLTVTEMFDRRENRGWIKVEELQKNDAQVFIDGKLRQIFAFSERANECKRVSSVKTLVELGPEFEGENSDFDPKKMYGLAALWIKLSAKPMKLYSWFKQFADGSRRRVHTYSTSVSQSASKSGQSPGQSVRVNFVEKRSPTSSQSTPSGGEVKTRSKPKLTIESILIIPENSKGFANKVPSKKEYTTMIHVDSIGRSVEPSEWKLPQKCAQLMADGSQQPMDEPKIEELDDDKGSTKKPDSDTPVDSSNRKYAEENFPRLTPLLFQLNKFLMRSEVIVRTSKDSSIPSKTYLLDEWYYNGNVRLKSYSNNERELDFLIYPLSFEYFDLSQRYKCLNNHIPKIANVSLTTADEFVSSSKLAQFWRDNQTLVDSPAEVYYGPLALWYMAEKNLAYAELEETFTVAPEIKNPSKKKVDGDLPVSQDLEKEVWKVRSPPNSLNQWTVRLEMEKVTMKLEGQAVQTWHVLRQATVAEGNAGSERVVEIEIINYRYNHTLVDIVEQFVLPDGHGCIRSDPIVEANSHDDDAFSLDIRDDFQLVYEATLEILKEENDPELGNLDVRRKMLPALSGLLLHSGLSGSGKHDNFVLSGQFTRTRDAKDTAVASSKKTVTCRARSIKYEIDEVTGFCNIIQADDTLREFVLEFKTVDDSETFKIDVSIGEMIKFWFVESENRMTNKYVLGRTIYTTYEQFQSTLHLSSNLNGPASIIRTYTQDIDHRLPGTASLDGKVTKSHTELRTKVMLFDEKHEKLRAVLNLKLNKLPNPTISTLLQQLSVTDCYNNGLANTERRMGSYLIEYPLSDAQLKVAHYLVEVLRDMFYAKLLDEFNLDPTQLDGSAEIETDLRTRTMQVYFKVWDPSFYQYFAHRTDATISDSLVPLAETKSSPNLDDCFAFCQQLNCIVMSFCWLEHSCQVVPESSFHDPREEFNYEQTLKISESQYKHDCQYYYHMYHKKSLSIRKLSDRLDRYVNTVRSERQLGSLSLRVLADFTEPSKFVDLTEDTDFSEDVVDRIQSMFKISDLNYKLDLKQVDHLRDSEGNKFESHVVEAKVMHDCMDECVKADCIYLSHCRKNSICTLVTDSRDIHLLEKNAKVEATSDEGCTVAMRDYSPTYQKYMNTIAPSVSLQRLDDYTAVECAALCYAAEDKCLSFDHCKFESRRDDQDKTNLPDSVCFLQGSHLSMDSFEISILGMSLHAAVNELNDRKVSCNHYAKPILSNFRRIPNKRFTKRVQSIATARGESVERCAGMCFQKEDCEAFEHCVNVKRMPVQSCRFMQLSAGDGDESKGVVGVEQIIDAKTIIKNDCSVYYRTKLSVEEELSQNLHSETWLESMFEKHSSSVSSYLPSLMLYLLAAVLVGLSIQVIYLRTTGRPIVFR